MKTYLEIPFVHNYLMVKTFIFRRVSPKWSVSLHHHNMFELLYCCEGQVRERINNKVIHFREGDWLLLKSGVRHETINVSGKPFAFMSFLFDIDDVALRKYLTTNANLYISRKTAETSKLPVYAQEIINLVNRHGDRGPIGLSLDNETTDMIDDDENPTYIELSLTQKLAFQSYVMLLVMEFINTSGHDNAAAADYVQVSTYELEIANKVAALLDENVFSDVHVQDIASRLGMSRSRLTRIFSKVYGLPPRQYLSNLKMKIAKEMLIETDLPMVQIADRLGFTSPSLFSRQFKRWTGVSPSFYRPKHSKLDR